MSDLTVEEIPSISTPLTLGTSDSVVKVSVDVSVVATVGAKNVATLGSEIVKVVLLGSNVGERASVPASCLVVVEVKS